jgi:putative phosphoesterase
MMLGVIADVHCRHEELRLVADALVRDGADEILLAGDAHDQYRFSNEVVDVIRDYEMRYILGNHEGVLLSTAGERAVTAPHVRRHHLDFVRSTPSELRVRIRGRMLTMVHANPWVPDNAYLYAHSRLFDRCAELDTDFLILGHTHIPMAFRRGRTLVVNPGSLVFSRGSESAGLINYAILDVASGEARQVGLSRRELSDDSPRADFIT